MNEPKRPYYIPDQQRHESRILEALKAIKDALGDAAPKLGQGAVIRRPSDETMKKVKHE